MSPVIAPTPYALVDQRVYTIALRKMPEYLEVFHRLAMPVLRETLGRPLGFYTSLRVIPGLHDFAHAISNSTQP